MNSPTQEILAQIMFWGSIGSLPLAVGFGICGLSSRNRAVAFSFFLGTGLLLTHFLWYFSLLGGALSTKVGTYIPPFWFGFLPYGLAVGVALALFWHFRRQRSLHPGTPPPPSP